MDTELSMKLIEIVEKIGDTKNELCTQIGKCRSAIAVVEQKLDDHLVNELEKDNKKERIFDKKTVILGIIIGVVGLVAAFKWRCMVS